MSIRCEKKIRRMAAKERCQFGLLVRGRHSKIRIGTSELPIIVALKMGTCSDLPR